MQAGASEMSRRAGLKASFLNANGPQKAGIESMGSGSPNTKGSFGVFVAKSHSCHSPGYGECKRGEPGARPTAQTCMETTHFRNDG